MTQLTGTGSNHQPSDHRPTSSTSWATVSPTTSLSYESYDLKWNAQHLIQIACKYNFWKLFNVMLTVFVLVFQYDDPRCFQHSTVFLSRGTETICLTPNPNIPIVKTLFAGFIDTRSSWPVFDLRTNWSVPTATSRCGLFKSSDQCDFPMDLGRPYQLLSLFTLPSLVTEGRTGCPDDTDMRDGSL